MNKNPKKMQHIVPKSLIKRWSYNIPGLKASYFCWIDIDFNINVQKKNDPKSFAEIYFFEDNQEKINNRIENKLKRLENRYAILMDSVINLDSSRGFVNGRVKFKESEKCLFLIFALVQESRTNLKKIDGVQNRTTELLELEKILDFYSQKIGNKEPEVFEEYLKEFSQKYEIEANINNTSPENLRKFEREFFSDVPNQVYKQLIDKRFTFFLNVYPDKIWPLGVSGPFVSYSRSPKSNQLYKIWIWPISPNAILLRFPILVDDSYYEIWPTNSEIYDEVWNHLNSMLSNEAVALKTLIEPLIKRHLRENRFPIIIPKKLLEYYQEECKRKRTDLKGLLCDDKKEK